VTGELSRLVVSEASVVDSIAARKQTSGGIRWLADKREDPTVDEQDRLFMNQCVSLGSESIQGADELQREVMVAALQCGITSI
jgi:hypothetical protein